MVWAFLPAQEEQEDFGVTGKVQREQPCPEQQQALTWPQPNLSDLTLVRSNSEEQASSLLNYHSVPWCEAYLWCEGLGCQHLLSSWTASFTRKQYCPFALRTEERRALGPWRLLGLVERDPQETWATSSGDNETEVASFPGRGIWYKLMCWSVPRTSQYTLGLVFA